MASTQVYALALDFHIGCGFLFAVYAGFHGKPKRPVQASALLLALLHRPGCSDLTPLPSCGGVLPLLHLRARLRDGLARLRGKDLRASLRNVVRALLLKLPPR